MTTRRHLLTLLAAALATTVGRSRATAQTTGLVVTEIDPTKFGQDGPGDGRHCYADEVCIERAAADSGGYWNGMKWKSLLPAVKGGDIVPRVDVVFTSGAIRNDYHLEMQLWENVRGPDQAKSLWQIFPSELGLRADTTYRITGSDLNRCRAISSTKRWYTQAKAYTFSDSSFKTESDDIKVDRTCNGG